MYCNLVRKSKNLKYFVITNFTSDHWSFSQRSCKRYNENTFHSNVHIIQKQSKGNNSQGATCSTPIHIMLPLKAECKFPKSRMQINQPFKCFCIYKSKSKSLGIV